MRIAYFARISLEKPSGVLRKILRQIRCWENQGHEVKLFALTPPFEKLYPGLENISLDYEQTKNYPDLLLKAVPLQRKIAAWEPDLVFIRYSSYYPLLKQTILKKFPVIADLNSNYDLEYQQIHNRFAYFFHQATKGYFFRNVSGFTTLTNELAGWLGAYNKPIAVIGDGINLDEVAPLPPAGNVHPVLVCFASRPFPWIALDKIFLLASKFPSWQIEIIGLSRDQGNWINVPDNVRFHGFLDKEEYRQILGRSDIAIGTLGLHRIGLAEMAPLKLREYLGYGLPSIIAYRDTDFYQGAPFILGLPNQEDNILPNLDRIEEFVMQWKGKRVPRQSVAHIDIVRKEDLRLEFFQNTLNLKN